MRAVVIYRDGADYTRMVEEFIEVFERRTGKEIEKINPDSIAGEIFCVTHDVVEYPTIMGVDDDGRVLQEWRGISLPTIDEVSFYAKEKGAKTESDNGFFDEF